MLFGREVGLGSGNIVLDGTERPPPKKKGDTAPNFRPMYIVAKLLDASVIPLATEIGLGPGVIVLDHIDGGPDLPPKGARPPIFDPCLLWLNGRSSQLLLSSY